MAFPGDAGGTEALPSKAAGPQMDPGEGASLFACGAVGHGSLVARCAHDSSVGGRFDQLRRAQLIGIRGIKSTQAACRIPLGGSGAVPTTPNAAPFPGVPPVPENRTPSYPPKSTDNPSPSELAFAQPLAESNALSTRRQPELRCAITIREAAS